MKSVTIGATALCLFKGLPAPQAGWLLKAWIDYKESGKEPSDVPARCLGAWLAVKQEMDNMAALSQVRSKNGQLGNDKRYGRENFATVCDSKTSQRDSKTSQIEIKKENINNSQASDERKAGGAAGAPAGEPPPPPIPEPTQPSPVPAPTPRRQAAVKAPAGLAVEMEGAPLTAEEAWTYATSGQVAAPATAKQVIKWANCQSKNGWRNKGGFLMRKSEAAASLRGWLMEDLSRRGGGAAAGGDGATVRGVRVENRGGGLTADF